MEEINKMVHEVEKQEEPEIVDTYSTEQVRQKGKYCVQCEIVVKAETRADAMFHLEQIQDYLIESKQATSVTIKLPPLLVGEL